MTRPSTPALGSLFDLSGRTAIVTGGSRGLGLQIAEGLAEFGARLILTARKAAELEDARDALSAFGPSVSTYVCDVGRPDQVASLVDAIAAEHGHVDILINNAGTSWGAPTVDHSLEGWQKVVDLNLTAAFLLTQAVGRRWMVPARRGRVINIASIAGMRGQHHTLPATIAYSSTKGGLIALTRALAGEWGPHNVTVNAISPGYFRSKMTNHTLDAHEARLIDATPLGKLGGPADLKGAAVLLASDAGGHITGQVISVDGGASAI